MKYIIIAVFLSSTLSMAQTLTYQNTQDLALSRYIDNDQDFTAYQAQDGSVVHIGDTMIIGVPSTQRNSFTYVYDGKANALNLVGVRLPIANQGEKVIIDRVTAQHTEMSKKSPVTMVMFMKNPVASAMRKTRTIIDFEQARNFGEIINPDAPLTGEQVMANLKESKLKELRLLVDLGLLTQKNYDSIRTVIMGN